MNSPQSSTRIHTVLVMSWDAKSHNLIEDMISMSSRFQSILIDPEHVATFQPATPPEIIIVDIHEFSQPHLEALSTLRRRFTDIPLILVSKALDDGQIRQLLKLQVHDWLRKPLDKKLFHNALITGTQLSKSTTSQVHAIISPIGGVGTTSIAISSADLMAKKLKKNGSVALFDLDFSTGNCGYALNIKNTYNLETIVDTPSRIDAEFIDIINQRHKAGFSIFSFKRPEIVTNLTGTELVLRMLDAVSMQHHHTILDIPYYEVPWKNEVLSAVDTVTIVSNITLPAIKHAKELSQRIRSMRSDKLPIQIVFNKYQRKWFGGGVRLKNVKEVFKKFEMVRFAEDHSTMEEAVNRGILPSEVNQKSPFLKDLGKYLDRHILARVEKK